MRLKYQPAQGPLITSSSKVQYKMVNKIVLIHSKYGTVKFIETPPPPENPLPPPSRKKVDTAPEIRSSDNLADIVTWSVQSSSLSVTVTHVDIQLLADTLPSCTEKGGQIRERDYIESGKKD
jgi:hypothetical protein